jgi:hypothetical protein
MSFQERTIFNFRRKLGCTIAKLGFALALFVPGCSSIRIAGNVGESEDGTSSGISEPAAGLGQPQTDCGSRTVSNVPSASYLAPSVTIEGSVDPPESTLANVLAYPLFCPALFAQSESIPRQWYEVGEQGAIIAIVKLDERRGCFSKQELEHFTGRFVLRNGCLATEFQLPNPLDPTQDFTFTLPGFQGTGEIPPGLCEDGQLPVDRSGYSGSMPQGEYTCVSFTLLEEFCGCGSNNGVWYSEAGGRVRYEAEGSLDRLSNLTAAFFCQNPDLVGPFEIRAGQRATITLRLRTEYRTSPSPEQLGYEPCDSP